VAISAEAGVVDAAASPGKTGQVDGADTYKPGSDRAINANVFADMEQWWAP
jgi:hypothetical protein